MQKSVVIQDIFLNQLRKEGTGVCLNLLDGTNMRGQIKGFDSFILMFENERQQQVMVYKHAIASIIPDKGVYFTSAENK
ncbi:MAG: RNA chaperone Hfq [Bacillota bacterium]